MVEICTATGAPASLIDGSERMMPHAVLMVLSGGRWFDNTALGMKDESRRLSALCCRSLVLAIRQANPKVAGVERSPPDRQSMTALVLTQSNACKVLPGCQAGCLRDVKCQLNAPSIGCEAIKSIKTSETQ